jgi:anaerobic selenocysteine-containing dehydrogenase
MKGCTGLNNFDAILVCVSSAVSGYIQALGLTVRPAPATDDLDETKAARMSGSNLARCHPILLPHQIVLEAPQTDHLATSNCDR